MEISIYLDKRRSRSLPDRAIAFVFADYVVASPQRTHLISA
ncbi:MULTISPECIES: hypothetical protein [Nostocaceae]|nr:MULTISPECIES: hypothetical protein [Nostocaceae]